MERNENGFSGNSVGRRSLNDRGSCTCPGTNGNRAPIDRENGMCPGTNGNRAPIDRENGMSPGNNGCGSSVERENSRCPGTGDMWRPDTEMSPELLAGHKNCSAYQLGMVYSPYQCWRMLYTVEEALKHGTLFEELHKPLEER